MSDLETPVGGRCPHGHERQEDCLSCKRNRELAGPKGSDELRERFATEMVKRGLATGHGDTLADLHREMWWQFDEIRSRLND